MFRLSAYVTKSDISHRANKGQMSAWSDAGGTHHQAGDVVRCAGTRRSILDYLRYEYDRFT